MDVSDRMSVRGSLSIAPSVTAASDFGDGMSLGLRSVSDNLKRFMSSFPKEVKRKNIQDLYFSLLLGRLEGCMEYDDVANALLALVFNLGTPYLDRLLAVNCLQQLAPQYDLCTTMAAGELESLVNCLPVVLSQGREDEGFQNIVEKLFKYIASENDTDPAMHQRIFFFFNQLMINDRTAISSDNTKLVLSKLLSTLASDGDSGPGQSRIKKIDASKVIREVDGTISMESFTPLSITETTTGEQLFKIQSFSMILSWLHSIYDPKLDLSEQTLNIERHLSPSFCNTLRALTLRLIEQSDRSPVIRSNVEIQKACLVEALCILDIICMLDRGQVALMLSMVRKIFDRNVSAFYQDVSICCAAAQFLIRHSSAVMHKTDDIGPHLLSDVVGSCYHDVAAAFEIVKFVQDNLTKLCYNSSLLERYFPSLLKIVAWHPSVFENDFLHILPAFLSAQTAIEVFHSLMDLPCLTASLIISQACLKQSKGTVESSVDSSLSDLYQSSEYQAMFNFVLRPVGGMGHTFDRLSAFHKAIGKLVEHPRVVRSAKTTLSLLKCFSQICVQFADTGFTSLLFPAILERLTLIYPVPNYKDKINSFLAEFVLQLLEKHPDVVVHMHEELVDYLSKMQNALDSPLAFTHMAWAVGEFLSLTYTELFRLEVVNAYYNTLECLVYEFQSVSPSLKGENKYKLICVLLTTLAQLATRCQDLLPRAVLCLSKSGQKLMALQEGEDVKLKTIAIDRIRELLAILGTPNVASQVLSPPKTIYSERWHEDATSLPITLKTIVSLMEPEESVEK